jgi:triphosphoribosyl-dephospho-CoA synthase
MNHLQSQTIAAAEPQARAHRIARLAVRSLYHELALYPKPGLVSLRDNGAHRDMDAATFVRSLFSLRGYFATIAAAGMRDAGLAELQQLGIAAESRMLQATRGINTHRGAIFTLGLLAAAGVAICARSRLQARQPPATAS